MALTTPIKDSASRYDVIVVGGGHAGCEAALAAARMGCSALLITLSLEKIALMPCNPAVGGVGKGQLTREIDALGGEQGRNTDRSFIQMKMLNTGKGPAVRSLRAQTDKRLYEDNMKRALAAEPNLRLLEASVARLIVSRETIAGIELTGGQQLAAAAVVLACGTFLRGRIVIGALGFPAGRMGEPPALKLSDSLADCGLELKRFQSATPPRIDGRTIDPARMAIDSGDAHPQSFSPFSRIDGTVQMPCYLTYTNEKTHDTVRSHIHLSPIKTGAISGKGPRYCPSIDRKIINFPDRERHPVFVEPEGRRTQEMYLQGLTTSMPVEVQEKVINAVRGLERARLMRPGYAVEYDYVVPSQLHATLETNRVARLYCAGQINGTSGYEEAAAQGLIAGVNAALAVRDREPFTLGRDQAYIGVLIDDLVSKGVDEPYRMFTSRAEYRLLLRHDNAHSRLSPLGHSLGLVSDADLAAISSSRERVDSLVAILNRTRLKPSDTVNATLKQRSSSPITEAQPAAALLRRPELAIGDLLPLLGEAGPAASEPEIAARAEIEVKYAGYIARQLEDIERHCHLEESSVPADFAYEDLAGISIEAREKLSAARPDTLGQASRIAGVSPADVAILSLYLRARRS